MFDEKFIEEYKAIKAPDELYGRIMNPAKTEVKGRTVPFGRIVSAAACFAVLIAAVAFMLNTDRSPEIYVGDKRLTGEISLTEKNTEGLMLARMGTEVSCEFSFSFEKETAVSISDGVLYSSDGAILLENGNEEAFSGILKCRWSIMNADEGTVYEMTLSDSKKSYLIVLSFDSDAGQWTAQLTE